MVDAWTVDVDAELCQGAGVCVGTAAEHFRMEGLVSRVVNPRVTADESVADAARCCPYSAITVVDTASGELLFPTDG